MNDLKVFLLLGCLSGMFVLVGSHFGGSGGAIMALGFAAVMNLGAYFLSDRIVLKMYRAKEVSDEELKGVMAHELAHVGNRDILIGTIAATAAGAVTMIAAVVSRDMMRRPTTELLRTVPVPSATIRRLP